MSYVAPMRKNKEAAWAGTGAAPGVFSSLRIGEANDVYEQEADRVAEAVTASKDVAPQWSFTRMNVEAPLRRKCNCGGAGAARGEAPPIVHQVVNSPGEPLDAATRAVMEPRFGRDLSSVRIHNDAYAQQSAQAVEANAYAVGPHIVFNRDQFAPRSRPGFRLLAHELAHVVQQSNPGDAVVPDGTKTNPFQETSISGSHSVILQRDPMTAPVPPALPNKIIPGNSGLSRQVQAYRVDHPGLPDGTNLVGVEFSEGGQALQTKIGSSGFCVGDFRWIS